MPYGAKTRNKVQNKPFGTPGAQGSYEMQDFHFCFKI